ncbi:proline-rich protein 5-like [Asterias amurensis]|uniref:proline-rich protein 5-like n=1 Tax=Asterias amurensis TaxID=7602 RepID=UPI003AB1989F
MINKSRQSLANIAPPLSSLGHRQGSQGDISRALFGKVKGVGGGRRGSAMAVMQRAEYNETAIKSQQVLGLRNDDWNSVQKKVLSLFRGGRLAPGELDDLNEQVRAALKSEIGEFITDYYKKNLLRRGLDVMYGAIVTEDGPKLLASLAKQWTKFFCEILPTLRAIFCPVQVSTTRGLTILQLSLLGFRDHIVLKLHTLKDALSADRSAVPNEIVQMLLHLQSVRESGYPSEEHLHIESLVAKVVCPYLGTRGLYFGGDEPTVAAKIQPMMCESSRRRQENGRGRSRPTSLQFTEPTVTSRSTDVLSSPTHTPTMSPREHSASLGAIRRSPNSRRRGSHVLSSLETLLEDEKKRTYEMTDHEC